MDYDNISIEDLEHMTESEIRAYNEWLSEQPEDYQC